MAAPLQDKKEAELHTAVFLVVNSTAAKLSFVAKPKKHNVTFAVERKDTWEEATRKYEARFKIKMTNPKGSLPVTFTELLPYPILKMPLFSFL